MWHFSWALELWLLFWTASSWGLIQWGTVNDQPSQNDDDGKWSLQNGSCIAENVKIKVAWKLAGCQGLHSNSASEEKEGITSVLQKGKLGAGQDKLSTFPSYQGDQICPHAILMYICFDVNHYPTKTHSLFHVSCLDNDVLTLLPALRLRFCIAPWSGDLRAG